MPDPLALVATALVAWLYAIAVFAVRGDGRSGRAARGRDPSGQPEPAGCESYRAGSVTPAR